MSITQVIAKHTDNAYQSAVSDRVDPSEKKSASKYYYRHYRLYHHARIARDNRRDYYRHRQRHLAYSRRYWCTHPERRAHDYRQKRTHYWRDRVREVGGRAK